MHVVVAGCGWLGTALATALLGRGHRVTGVRRDPDRARALGKLGIAPMTLDLAAPGAASRLPRDLDAIVACQSATFDGAEAYRRAYVDGNRTLLEIAASGDRARPLVYTGSTGVFGQRDGGDVDETTPVAPASATGEVLVEAEELLRGAASAGAAVRIVRLSGLYGPGRMGVVERVRSGAMALGPGDDAWTNWCHLADAVGIVLAALDRGTDGALYHASDAEPMRRRDVVTWVAARLGIAPPRRGDAVAGAPVANRRVLGDWTRSTLGYALAYRSLRDGLAPLLVT